MKLRFNASTIKSWFQYRCERQVVYKAMDPETKSLIPILEVPKDNPWALLGNEYEAKVVKALARREPGRVLQPITSASALSDPMTRAFLDRTRKETYAHQVVLKETDLLRARLNLSDNVTLTVGKPDIILVEEGPDGPIFHIIDVKATQRATVFHKAQVAFYALMLRATLDQAGLPGSIASHGQVWRLPSSGDLQEGAFEAESFPLRGYVAMVEDFFARQVPRMATRTIGPGVGDDTFFHLYFKCEQCAYLPHCHQAIATPAAAANWDVSAVAGLTHESKLALARAGIRRVGELATAKGLKNNPSIASWVLRARGNELVDRAQALVTGSVSRQGDRLSYLMPPKVDVAIHLTVDHDPVDGRLVALGCRVVAPDGLFEDVAVIAAPAQELDAIKQILGRVVTTLMNVERSNTEGTTSASAHIYLYEPSEAQDLQAALGRHLNDEAIRTSLLDLVRLFPPEEALPEPEYRGVHHLPATAVRSVVSQLYALPAAVSYDLARVTQALASASPPLEIAYRPATMFERPFSSRLPLEVSRELRAGSELATAVEGDVRARLQTLDALRQWIEADNARADVHFLRLKKNPFRFQSTFDPLQATDLDVLLAQEILENRAGLLGRLVELAAPAEQRRDRFRCLADLKLEGIGQNQAQKYWMKFTVPPASMQAELGSGTMGLILHDDSADIRLNPTAWPQFAVKIVANNGDYPSNSLLVEVPKAVFESTGFKRLRTEKPEGPWYIDETFVDFNTQKITEFLRFLAGV